MVTQLVSAGSSTFTVTHRRSAPGFEPGFPQAGPLRQRASSESLGSLRGLDPHCNCGVLGH